MPTPLPIKKPKLPAAARRSLLLYNLFFPFALLVMLPGILARMMRRGGYREKFSQRLGRFTPEDLERLRAREWTWVHSISVGETMLALKLARKIHALDPARGIVLSVTTSTGFAVAQKEAAQASDWLEVIYNPLDAPWIVRNALRAVRPRAIVFIEAIWPNLLASAKRCGIPSMLVARMSPRSEARFRKFRALTGPVFRLLDAICVQEPEDVVRWESLGAETARVHRTGAIKFDHADGAPSREEEFRALVRGLGVADDAPVLLAGSTFPGEEKAVAEIFQALLPEFPRLFLILVPRHVERTPDIIADLRPLGLDIALRTDLEAWHGADANCLIVDTTGELRDWYHLASIVFIGKSLGLQSATGGQNPVEPVAAGKPVLFGPRMENFAAIVQHLLAHEAATQVADTAALKTQITALLRDPALRTRANASAHEALAPHQGATARAAELLLRISP